jgi:hypothetical protein
MLKIASPTNDHLFAFVTHWNESLVPLGSKGKQEFIDTCMWWNKSLQAWSFGMLYNLCFYHNGLCNSLYITRVCAFYQVHHLKDTCAKLFSPFLITVQSLAEHLLLSSVFCIRSQKA